MTIDGLDKFLKDNPRIECAFDEGGIHGFFRNTDLPWYANNKGNATRVRMDKIMDLDESGLRHAIDGGLDVDHITRITGYMTRVSGWNKGKLGELKDRYRNEW